MKSFKWTLDELTNESGFLLAYKPEGMTSSDLVQKVRRILGLKKIGHTGTLDKHAEGLMILPYGQYTCFSDQFLKLSKTYWAEVQFGRNTDSGDRDGEILQDLSEDECETVVRENWERLQRTLLEVPGWKLQKAPKISALKVGGVRQAKLVRSGVAVEEKERTITISSFEVKDLNSRGMVLETCVSSGTYIRKLVQDIGEQSQIPMYVKRLVRTSVGRWNTRFWEESDSPPVCFPISEFEALELPRIQLDWSDVPALAFGQKPELSERPAAETFLMADPDGRILAWAQIREGGKEYKYLKVFAKN